MVIRVGPETFQSTPEAAATFAARRRIREDLARATALAAPPTSANPWVGPRCPRCGAKTEPLATGCDRCSRSFVE